MSRFAAPFQSAMLPKCKVTRSVSNPHEKRRGYTANLLVVSRRAELVPEFGESDLMCLISLTENLVGLILYFNLICCFFKYHSKIISKLKLSAWFNSSCYMYVRRGSPGDRGSNAPTSKGIPRHASPGSLLDFNSLKSLSW